MVDIAKHVFLPGASFRDLRLAALRLEREGDYARAGLLYYVALRRCIYSHFYSISDPLTVSMQEGRFRCYRALRKSQCP